MELPELGSELSFDSPKSDIKILTEINYDRMPPSLDEVMEVLENDIDYQIATTAESLFIKKEEKENPVIPLSQEKREKKPCEVCGSPTKGTVFYGAISCNPCRAFFKRACLSTLEIVCFGDRSKKCTQYNCRKCRLDKCVKAGMNPALVYKRFTRVSALNRGPEQLFTLEDEIKLRGIWSTVCAWDGQYILNSLDTSDPHEKISEGIFNLLGLSSELLFHLQNENAYMSYLIPMYSTLPPFKKKPLAHVQKMIKNLLPLSIEMCLAYSIKDPFFLHSFYQEFSQWLKRGELDTDFSHVISKQITSYIQKGPASVLSYEQAFHNIPLKNKKRHMKLLENVVKNLSGNDEITWVIVTMIILTNDDHVQKNYFLKLLYGYVKKYKPYQNGNDLINKMAMLPEKLKELRQMRISESGQHKVEGF